MPITRSSSRFKVIAVDRLRPGMYVHDLRVSWLDHPFWRSRFLVDKVGTVERLRSESVKEVVIDTLLGADVDQPTSCECEDIQPDTLSTDFELGQRYAAKVIRYSPRKKLGEEKGRIRFLKRESTHVVRSLLEAARSGQKIDIQRAEPIIEKMMASVMRCPDALIPLLRLKDYNEYTFQHSVSVSALSLAFGIALEMDGEVLRQIGLGALLHDIGKMAVPTSILDKPGPLNDDERGAICRHPLESHFILANTRGVSQLSIECAAFHHERIDGTGYPYGLSGDDVPLHAQIVSIADAYDAMTSERCYRQHIEPTEALRRLFSSAGTQFRESLLRVFVRTVGVYPVGSLVRLDNGFLAVVLEVDRNDMLNPLVKVVFDTNKLLPIQPYEVDLARWRTGPRIVSAESFAKWEIDPVIASPVSA